MDETQTPITHADEAPAPATIEEAKKNVSYGSLVGIALIAALLVIGAFYAFGSQDEGEGTASPEEGVRGGEPVPPIEGEAEGATELEAEGPQPI